MWRYSSCQDSFESSYCSQTCCSPKGQQWTHGLLLSEYPTLEIQSGCETFNRTIMEVQGPAGGDLMKIRCFPKFKLHDSVSNVNNSADIKDSSSKSESEPFTSESDPDPDLNSNSPTLWNICNSSDLAVSTSLSPFIQRDNPFIDPEAPLSLQFKRLEDRITFSGPTSQGGRISVKVVQVVKFAQPSTMKVKDHSALSCLSVS